MYEAPIIAWIVAFGLGLVVLGFCSYEVGWKALRLRRDTLRLRSLNERVARLQTDLATAAQRLAALTPVVPGAADARR